jgi:hypothetical protein
VSGLGSLLAHHARAFFDAFESAENDEASAGLANVERREEELGQRKFGLTCVVYEGRHLG